MKYTIINLLALTAAVTAFPSYQKRQDAPVGVYQAPGPNDVRSPCPALNTLANHGYFPRNGQGLTFSMMVEQLYHVLGASPDLTSGLALAALSIKNSATSDLPFGLNSVQTQFGMRDPGELCDGSPCINLDQADLHGAVEHDVSLVRKDFAEGDNHSVQPDLVAQLVAASSDGEYITISDLIAFRAARLATQQANNPSLKFGKGEALLAHGEQALLLGILGDRLHGGRVTVSAIQSFLGQETLPTDGWSKKLIPVTLVEMNLIIAEIIAKEHF